MKRDNWTAEEYREFLRTGREPMRIPKEAQRAIQAAGAGKQRSPEQQETEDARNRAVQEGRVYAMDIPADPGNVIPISRAKGAEGETGKRRKYGNEPCYLDGKRFDSKHEALVYKDLMFRVKAGELRCVVRQVRFDLTEAEKLQYVADFVTIGNDMKVEVLDAKSEATRKNPVYIIKKKLMREKWGLEIREV